MNKKKVALLLMAASTVGAVTLSQETVYATENGQGLVGDTPTAQMARATQRGQVVNVQTNLRLREQPNTDSKVLGYLNNGQSFDIKGKSGDWYQIQTNDKVGYVHKDYVKEISGSIDNNTSNDSTTSTSKGQVINVSSNLRIRQTPSTSGSIVGYLINGETFNIKGKSGDWYHIDASGKVGYVHKDYVKELNSSTSTPSTPAPSPEPPVEDNSPTTGTGQVVNISSSLRIRQSASTSSSVIGYLYNGDKFDIKGKSGDWYYINANGKVGYVHKDYVKELSSGNTTPETPAPTPDQTPEPTPPSQDSNTVPAPENPQEAEVGTVYNVTTNLRMRNKPSSDGQVLAYILPNEKVTIKGSTGSWYYIEYNGKVGYAHQDYIRKGEVTTPTPEEKPNEESTSSKYEEVLAVMKAQVGSPYVYGAAGEIVTQSLIDSLRSKYSSQSNYDLIGAEYIDNGYRGFDCSGLMQWSFKQVGITLGRSTYDQMNNGVGVSSSEAKPGDLLFRKSGTHVGMYLGNNQWLESPNSGKQVRIVDVPWSDIGTIRRVL